ncbi:MAG: FKBP-type peptidyl-prolyl cis-trans isomerase [Candidatus Odinarchaeota archaeon]
MAEVVKEGDFILIDFDMKLDDDKNTIVETTSEEKAKKSGIHDPRYPYRPELVVVGHGYVVKGLDEALAGMKINEEKKDITVPPEKGFGRRDSKLIEERTVRWLKAKNIRPMRNVKFQEKGKIGRIISVKQQKASVDFNPPLAGKTLIFDVKVIEIVKDAEKKVKLLVNRHFGMIKDEELELESKDDLVTITLPIELMLAQGGQIMAARLVGDIGRLTTFEKIKISYFLDYSKIKDGDKATEVIEEGSED